MNMIYVVFDKKRNETIYVGDEYDTIQSFLSSKDATVHYVVEIWNQGNRIKTLYQCENAGHYWDFQETCSRCGISKTMAFEKQALIQESQNIEDPESATTRQLAGFYLFVFGRGALEEFEKMQKQSSLDSTDEFFDETKQIIHQYLMV